MSRAGDLWVLEPHRLVCGDSHEPTSYQYLLEGKQADLVLTDPLFNIAIDGSCSDREADVATASGEMSEAQFIASLTAVLQHSKENTKDGAILFVFMDWRHLYELITASREVGLALKDIVVWAKGDAAGAAKGNFYRCRHELVLVFKNGDHVSTNTLEPGQHGRTNIWDYAAVGGLPATRRIVALHRPGKPTALVADAIRDVTGRGAIVLDPFAGTGTTIIAAEKTGRQGRAIERDPLYCDLIIRRWQQYTGKAARLAGSDQTFADVEAVRLLGQSTSTAKRSGGSVTCPKNPIPQTASRWNLRPTDRRANQPKSTRLALVRPPAGQAVEERRAIAKSPWAAAEGTVDASGPQEGIRTGHQQKGRGSPRR